MKRLPTSVLILLVLTACSRYVPPSSKPRLRAWTRDHYEDGILRGAMGRSAAYSAWSSAARRALRDRLMIRPSFREQLYFSPERPTAVGYRLPLRRGQRVHVDLAPHSGAGVFTEIFEEIPGPEPIYRLVQTFSLSQTSIAFEATTDGPYVVRLQPQMFKGGEITVTVATAAALTFPVAGKSSRAIGSVFGDSRDGGARSHEGIDIFAAAGTPVLAVAPGVITTVNTTRRGGNVVWHYDPQRNVQYYYAHLTTQAVRTGDRVRAGDMIGTVGRTGNARGTPPHLHFGVYRPGRIAIDPVPFIFHQPGNAITPLLVDLSALGGVRTAATTSLTIRATPSQSGSTIATVANAEPVYVIGGVGEWYRVSLEDGRTGFVRARDIAADYSSKGAH